MRADVGVVVVSYNTRDLLLACLASVAAESARAGLATEVHVVDNASLDGSAERVAAEHPAVRLHALEENAGFTAGNNVVLKAWLASPLAMPGRVLLLNPDAELLPGSLSPMLSALDADDRTAAVGPSLVYPGGSFQHAAFRFPGVAQAALDLFPPPGRLGARLLESWVNGRYDRRMYERGEPFLVDFVLGACVLIRAAALRDVGPLDEGYVMYCEEIDWCRRAREAGWRVLCAPSAQVLHHGGASSGQFRARSWGELWRSRRRYLRLHEPPWRASLVDRLLHLAIRRRRIHDARALRRGALNPSEAAARDAAYRTALADPHAEPPGEVAKPTSMVDAGGESR